MKALPTCFVFLQQDAVPTPYQLMGSEESLFERLNREDATAKKQTITGESQLTEPDYVDCQLLADSVRKAAVGGKSLTTLDVRQLADNKLSAHPPKVRFIFSALLITSTCLVLLIFYKLNALGLEKI